MPTIREMNRKRPRRRADRPQAHRNLPRSQSDAGSLSSWTCYPQVQTEREGLLTLKHDKTVARYRNAKNIFALRNNAHIVPESATRIASGTDSSADDDDMQSARPVGAEQQSLLDVGRARGAGDEIERARRAALAESAPEFGERALIVGEDRVARQHDDVIVGEKIEGRRVVGAGDE